MLGLYSCKVTEVNQEQLELVKKNCKVACQIGVSREYFGDSECPGADDAKMSLWLVYSCDGGGTDRTKSGRPTCKPGTGTGTGTDTCSAEQGDVEQGEMTQVDIPGCGGWVNIDCNGGCINIVKVLKSYFLSWYSMIIWNWNKVNSYISALKHLTRLSNRSK